MRRSLVLLALASLALAGCVSPGASVDPNAADAAAPPDYSHLKSADAAETLDAPEGVRTFVFEGTLSGGAKLIVGRDVAPYVAGFDVDGAVGFVEAELEYEPSDLQGEGVAALVKDHDGRTQCAAVSFVEPASCTVRVPDDLDVKAWSVVVETAFGATAPDMPFTVRVSLHPASHMTFGDPLEGVDRSISFRVSDTGVDGSEDNIGVLGDGTIFTQKRLHTMRSTDDGQTWEDVAPIENAQTTLDPMLFVDPWREVVFVDHLYVGCSILSWSTDKGDSWLTNPAACGRPGNDHQKVASGPNPLGLPVPAVYYSYSIPGVWASRSLDGGITWTSAPIVGVTDERQPSNTGPIFADEAGNVYVPMYMCDGDGYMGVGVSHDHGATWKFVVASDAPGPCYDVDPGLWTDTDGTVYLAYHRPDGVQYVYSEDAGETWSEPVVVSPPALKSFVHVDAVAGDSGRLAIVYRATPDTDKGPDAADGWAAWHLYVTFVENATAETPTVRTAIVTDPSDPIQRGPVCTAGIACIGGSRNLLDFIDIAVGPDGRVYPTFTDGCVVEGEAAPCATPADSRSRAGLVGIQEEGPRLFVDKAPWATG